MCKSSQFFSFPLFFQYFSHFFSFIHSFFPSFCEEACWPFKSVHYITVSFLFLDCLFQCVYLPVFISPVTYWSFFQTCFQRRYSRSLLDSGYTGLENRGGFLHEYLQSLRLDEKQQDNFSEYYLLRILFILYPECLQSVSPNENQRQSEYLR